MLQQIIGALVNGVAGGVPLFLVASGLTLIYGVMGILNFAHGSFFMIGAYALATILKGGHVSWPTFLLVALIGAAVVALIGVISERGIFARLYSEGHIVSLFASYALMLILNGLAILIFGASGIVAFRPTELSGAARFGTLVIPTYNIFLIAVGLVIAVGLWLLINKSPIGIKIRAVAHDRVTARALGVRAPIVGMTVFIIGGALAGLSGALAAPTTSVAPGLDTVYILLCFIVIIVGGLGSVPGALTAAILVGLVNSFLVAFAPAWSAYGMYILVGIVLLLRPQGLFVRIGQAAH